MSPLPAPRRFCYGPNELNFADLWLPYRPGPQPVAILIHGGFWRNSYDLRLMDKLAADLAGHGIAAWNIEYRRVGDLGGGWPGTVDDVALAMDYLVVLAESEDLDVNRLVAIGHSAGGHLAFWLAARPRLRQPVNTAKAATRSAQALRLCGAISLAGVVDLHDAWQRDLGRGAVRNFIGADPAEAPDRYAAASPAEALPLGVPQVIVHGSADESVPLVHSEQYVSQADASGDDISFISLAGVDHFALIDPTTAAWAATLVELDRLFSRPLDAH